MRRLLSWARSRRLILLLLAVLLPGVLSLTVLPVQAQVRIESAVNLATGFVDVPKQMMGTAAGLPSLVETSVTQPLAGQARAADEGDDKPLENAVPVELRDGVIREASQEPLAKDRSSLANVLLAADPPCGNVPAWRPNSAVTTGDLAAYAQRIWRAKLTMPGYVNTTPPPEDSLLWEAAGTCPLPPPPTITSMSPANGVRVMTTRPTFSASASTWPGGSVSFDFEVCDGPSMNECRTFEDCCATSGSVTVPEGVLGWGRQYWWRLRVSDASTIGGQDDTSEARTFVVGVRQPAITSQLSTPGVNGQEFHQASGNYTVTHTDAQVAVVGPPLAVVRSYNSMDPRRDGAFGAGWSSRWDMRVVEENVNGRPAALVTYPDGRQVRFAEKADGTYEPPPGMYATLAENADGGWRLMDKSATSYVFDGAGRLLEISDPRGRTQELTYGTDGKLATATSPGGRSLHFTWNGAHVASVSTDPVDGEALTWTYSYSGDVLESVCAPTEECTSYDHSPGSLYRSMVLDSDPMGYWRLGETSGSVAKDLGWIGGAHYNGSHTLGQPGALLGTSDTAVGITASNTPAINLPAGIIPRAGAWGSVETWFKTNGSGNIITVDGTWDDRRPLLQVTADGKLAAGYDAASRIVSTAQISDGAWHHAVLTASGNSQTLYVDGVAAGTFAGTISNIDHRYTEYMGVGGVAGAVDEVAVYDRPLSAAEVGRHYAARAVAPHKLTKITLPSGRVWAENTYDNVTDRIKTHQDDNGGTWQIGDTVPNHSTGMATITVTDPAGHTLTSVHDTWRGYRIVSQTDQLGKKTTYAYDTGGYLSKVTDANNNTVTRSNDKRGNALSTRTCRTTSNCQTSYASYYLNANDKFDPRNDRQTTHRDARSSGAADNTYATTFDYNEHGEPTKQTSPPTLDFPNGRSAMVTYTDGTESAIGGGTTPAGLAETATDPRDNTWAYRYTASGDLAEQTAPEGLVVKLEYDPLGRLKAKTEVLQAHPDGVRTMFAYDTLGRLTTQTEPAVRNEISGVTHTKRTTYAYDLDGNRLSETVADLTGGDAERVTVLTYDDHGRVEAITDPEGGVVHQTWNNLGKLASTTDPRGAVVEHAYTKRGELTTRTLKGWTGSPVSPQPAADVVLESFTYDPGGRLATRADAMGRKTSFIYFGDDLLDEKIADGAKLNGSTTADDVVLEDHIYDKAGNRTKLITGGGTTATEYVYDAAGLLTSQTVDPNALGRKTAFVYDANGNVVKSTRTAADSTRSEVTEFVYDKENRATKQTVENGDEDIVITTAYDERGLAIETTDPRGNGAGADRAGFTSTRRHDLLGRLVQVTAPEVQIDKAGSTARTQPSATYGYDTFGATTHQTDAEGRTVTSVFDKAGRLIRQTAPSYTPPGGTAVTPATLHEYDVAGQLVSSTSPRGHTVTAEYDKLGRQVRITDPAAEGQPSGRWIAEYDLAGEKLAGIDPTGARVEATYDDLGRQITSTVIERKPATVAFTTTMTYNQAGNLLSTVEPGNKTTTFKVNALGEVTSVTDPENDTTAMTYDLVGRLLTLKDPRDNSTVAQYDQAGRQIGAKDLDAAGAVVRTSGSSYDLAGNLVAATSPEGRVTRQTFDALNRVTSLIEPVSSTESITTSFGYDASGARTRLTDGRGNATWTTYNSLGLAETVIESATPAHPDAADRTWTQVYDAAGNAVATLEPGGVRIDRTFDQLGRVTKAAGGGGGAAGAEKTFGYDLAGRPTAIGELAVEYNDRGLPLSILKGTAQETAYAYDALGNPTQRIDAAGTADFTWDNASRLKTATDPVTGRKLTYGYDKASNLTSLTAAQGTTTTDSQAFTYDSLNRPLTHTLKKGGSSTGPQLAKITYGWDDDNNLTSKTTEGTAGAGTNIYDYDHAGRLTSWTAPGGAVTAYEWDASGNRTKAGDKTFTYDERNRLLSGDGSTYTYTPRGTLASETKNGATTQLTFDAFDRLIADGESVYSYDALDRLASRISGVNKQNFAYSGLSNTLAVITDTLGTVQARYGRDAFGALLGQQEGANPALATLTDLHGDLVATYSSTALATTTAYDPFGAITDQTGVKTNLGYQGEYTDPDTGKVNMHARWYQPGTGTFTSRDTWTLSSNPSVQANRYTYANASPLAYRDSTGHFPDGGAMCPPRRSDEWYYQQTSAKIPSPSSSPSCGKSDTGSKSTIISAEKIQKSAPNPAANNKTYNPGPSNPKQGQDPGPGKPKNKKQPKPDPGPTSKQIRNDPNNVTEDRNPPSKQDIIDYKCTNGPCGVSWSGHKNVIGGYVGDRQPPGTGPAYDSECGSWTCPSSPKPDADPVITPIDMPAIPDGSAPIEENSGGFWDWLSGFWAPTAEANFQSNCDWFYIFGIDDDPTCGGLPPMGDTDTQAWKDGYAYGNGELCPANPDFPNLKCNIVVPPWGPILGKKTLSEGLAKAWPKQQNGNCRECAEKIHGMIGGEIKQITTKYPVLGPSTNNPGENWYHHWVVVKDGKVYDGTTTPEGLDIETYKAQFEYAEDIDFGF